MRPGCGRHSAGTVSSGQLFSGRRVAGMQSAAATSICCSFRTPTSVLDRYEYLLPEIVRGAPGRDVDMLIYTPSELLDAAERPFIATALKEGKVIYEREQESA